MKVKMLSVFLLLFLLIQAAFAQRGIVGDGGGGDPPPSPTPTTTPSTLVCTNHGGTGGLQWGFYNWQWDVNPATTHFDSEMDFTATPDDFPATPGFTQVSVFQASSSCPAIKVHEVHGVVNVATLNSGSCAQVSMITHLLDQNGNAIGSAFVAELGPGTVNLPFKGSFFTPLSVTSLTLQFFLLAPCGGQVVSWSVTMS